MTAAVSPGSSGSPEVDENGQVVGIATFDFHNAQALNFARPVAYVSELLDQSKATTEVAPFWTVIANPKNVVLNDPDFVAAENALQKDNAAGALKLLNGIATKYPENGAFLFKLGAVYERLNLLDDAVQAYQHALKLEPTSGIGWTSLGSTLAKLKRFADAKDAARQAVKQSPNYGPAWALLGKLYSEESRYPDAADAFQKAAQLMPKDAEFWRSLADSYNKMNEPAKSQEVTSEGSTSNEWWVWETQGTRKVFGESQKITRGQKNGSDALPETAARPAAPAPPSVQTHSDNRLVYVVVAAASRGLHIRSEPNAKSAIVATLHRGDRVFVNEGRVSNNRPPSPVLWQKVTSMNADTGWINDSYIAPER
jgi:tetratricopeptide (TPR) repeat protein